MLTPEQEAIKAERRKVYGEPLDNHRGIAQMWAPLLQPHAVAITNGDPIPAWTVALLMAALKLDRMRLVYHADNYTDAAVYLGFAEEWQKPETPSEETSDPDACPVCEKSSEECVMNRRC